MIASVLVTVAAAIAAFVSSRWLVTGVFRRRTYATRIALACAALVLAVRAAHSDLGTSPETAAPTTPPDVEARNAPAPSIHGGLSTCASTPAGATATGALDLVRTKEGVLTVSAGIDRSAPLFFQGWAISADRRSLAKTLCLIVDGKPVLAATDYGSSRPDVAAVYRNDALLRSGYQIELPAGSLRPGTHSFEVAVLSGDGSGARIDKRLRLGVR